MLGGSLTAVIIDGVAGPSLLPRDHLQFELSGRFGYGRSLYARATIAELMPTETLLLDSDLSLAEAARRILERQAQARYRDVLVLSSDGPRVLPVSAVFERLALLFGHVAMHDPLTGLPNRRMLEEHGANLARRGMPMDRVAILYIDLDGFKAVNDTFGHRTGDELLIGFAERLRQSVRPSDIIARLGGDEFAALLIDVSEVEAAAVAERVVLTASAPFVVEDEPLYISATVGLAMADDVGAEQELTQLDVLLRHADGAMLKAKRAGKRQVGRLESSPAGSPLARAGLIRRKLRDALNHGLLSLHYQPKLDLASGGLSSVEALLRWTDPDLGPVSPTEFIPIAESSGQIHRIGHWVLHAACAQAARWRQAGTPRTVAINVSPAQLATDAFVADVLAALRTHGIAAELLRIEITEGSAVADLARTIIQLQALRGAGIEVDLDDFGTGYSSLSMLRQLPLTSVKIDKSFIDDIDTDPADALLVEGVIAAAHHLGMTVVAEGVERAEQLTALQRIGCDVAQGYYISRPVPASALEAANQPVA
jgi:diguanylate cyclase (GGDEF)-like protein